MDLGWCDVCLQVKSARQSREFYAGLGFYRVEGSDDQGWAVVTNGEVRLGLYEPRYMCDEPVTLNFRGGKIKEIIEDLAGKGYQFEPTANANSATLRDPDGYAIFFDTAPGEIKKTEPVKED